MDYSYLPVPIANQFAEPEVQYYNAPVPVPIAAANLIFIERAIVDQQLNAQLHPQPPIPTPNEQLHEHEIVQPVVEQIAEITNDNAQNTPKRKRHRTTIERTSRSKEKHSLLGACSCKQKCFDKIKEERRQEIYEQYWNLSYDERRSWMFGRINRNDVKRMRVGEGSKRNYTFTYMLSGEDESLTTVCKIMFLHTLGYSSDKVITVLMKTDLQSITPHNDKRGRHFPWNKKTPATNDAVIQHIESFKPSVSHYRREHAPLRRYLSSELTVQGMYEDFVQKNPDQSFKYQFYRKIVADQNISFTKLGEEQCETCLEKEKHMHENEVENCSVCSDWKKHIENARIARTKYREDAGKEWTDGTAYMSCDMQKVIMMPRMPGVKSAVFTRRVVLFHETFAPLGDGKDKPTLAVLWHEGISGRNADDVCSAFSRAIEYMRDYPKLIFWCDNCAGQNKNWWLYTCLVTLVNKEGGPSELTLKYLEKGHTFMSADSFHSRVEQAMKRKQNVYDLNDFVNVIQAARNTAQSLVMTHQNFRKWQNGMSVGVKATAGKPKLQDIQEVKFMSGSTKLYFKTSLEEDTYKECNFLKRNILRQVSAGVMPEAHDKPRGITSSKLKDIVDRLVPLMPGNRKEFWNTYPTSDTSKDLQVEVEQVYEDD